MSKGKSLSEKEKRKIEAFRRENIGIREIARRIGRSHQVVLSYLKNPAEYANKSTKPRKSKLSAREVVKTASNSMKSLKQIKQELNL